MVYLRSHVKRCADIFLVGDLFLSNWVDDSGQPEITDFNVPSSGQQNVFRFQVPVIR